MRHFQKRSCRAFAPTSDAGAFAPRQCFNMARDDLVSTMAVSPSPLSRHSRSILREEQNRSILDLLGAGASLFFFLLFFFCIINGTKQAAWLGNGERNKSGTSAHVGLGRKLLLACKRPAAGHVGTRCDGVLGHTWAFKKALEIYRRAEARYAKTRPSMSGFDERARPHDGARVRDPLCGCPL